MLSRPSLCSVSFFFFRYYSERPPVASTLFGGCHTPPRQSLCCCFALQGSGKTLAFTLPMLRHVSHRQLHEAHPTPGEHKQDKGTFAALLLAPTRELAQQIHKEVRALGKCFGLRSALLVGGSQTASSIHSLRAGVEVVIATPGRLVHMLNQNAGKLLSLRKVSFVVLDEADEMFSRGFGDYLKAILKGLPPQRQLVMFSATFPANVAAMARRVSKMHQPLEVVVGGEKARGQVNKAITQLVEVRPHDTRVARVLEVLGHTVGREQGSVLVFAGSQREVQELWELLLEAGYSQDLCFRLHGKMEDEDRYTTLSAFPKHESAVLISTAVAARGLDLRHVATVVNWAPPGKFRAYIHQCGRTGRAGRTGTALTFLDPEEGREKAAAKYLVRCLQDADQVIPRDLLALVDPTAASNLAQQQAAQPSPAGGAADNGEAQAMSEDETDAELNDALAEQLRTAKQRMKKLLKQRESGPDPRLRLQAVRARLHSKLLRSGSTAADGSRQRTVRVNIDEDDCTPGERRKLQSKPFHRELEDMYQVTVTVKGVFSGAVASYRKAAPRLTLTMASAAPIAPAAPSPPRAVTSPRTQLPSTALVSIGSETGSKAIRRFRELYKGQDKLHLIIEGTEVNVTRAHARVMAVLNS